MRRNPGPGGAWTTLHSGRHSRQRCSRRTSYPRRNTTLSFAGIPNSGRSGSAASISATTDSGVRAMTIIDAQVHAYEANTAARPWHLAPSAPTYHFHDHVTGDELVEAMDKV